MSNLVLACCDGGRRGSGETCSSICGQRQCYGRHWPRTRLAVPGSSCGHCFEKVRLESEMVKSRVKLEGLLKLIKTMEQNYYHPVDDSEEYKTYCAEYKAIETDLEKLRRGI
ncbi:hypothetical protein AVEN_156473-1 [Araneus ventricosus]|uniref:Uncharacterized protein n=1 Tax=Araneus ventricosus TaxID=182803 RepID=A0A4Y2TEY3_ARAVE|nr:hypothetical protein AVEN_156473-1 [Araneus ventricosus]